MEITVSKAALATAVGNAHRLLPKREPLGLLLTADANGLQVAGAAAEVSVLQRCTATVHVDGAVLVPARPLVETVRALDDVSLRLTVEASALAVRTDRGRFALPLLDIDAHPAVREPPPLAGTVAGDAFLSSLAVVAGACANDTALPMFTGVRVRALGDVLRLVGTDRFRMAVADVPWTGGGLDVLAPAPALLEVARQARGDVGLRADADRFGLDWAGGAVTSTLLATPFIDERRYLDKPADASFDASADALAAAVKRVGLFADERGTVLLDLADGEVRVRSTGTHNGNAEESVKASVTGRLAQHYRSRYLLDALHGFAERDVRVRLQTGMKPTTVHAADTEELRYIVMPILER
jgi:DNA polymerase-3 subunit beta